MTQSIVLRICEQQGVSAEEFFGRSKKRKLVAARRAAIDALQAEGFDPCQIACLIRRNVSTVHYRIKPEYGERCRIARRDKKRAAKEMRI